MTKTKEELIAEIKSGLEHEEKEFIEDVFNNFLENMKNEPSVASALETEKLQLAKRIKFSLERFDGKSGTILLEIRYPIEIDMTEITLRMFSKIALKELLKEIKGE